MVSSDTSLFRQGAEVVVSSAWLGVITSAERHGVFWSVMRGYDGATFPIEEKNMVVIGYAEVPQR